MEISKGCRRVCILLLYLTIAATPFTLCNARRSGRLLKGPVRARSSLVKHAKKLKVTKHFDLASLVLQKETMDSTNAGPYVSSPFTLPPFDSLGPVSLPDNAPPYCIYPPNTPQPPSTTIPAPTGYIPSSPPPPSSYLPPVLPVLGPPPSPPGFTPVPNPPEIVPSPPEVVPAPPVNIPGTPEGAVVSPPGIIPGTPESVPSPTIYVPSPSEPGPPFYEPSPPSYIPSPPIFVPSPTISVPSPRGFHPPVVYPPPTGPPSPRTSPYTALWCVAKPSIVTRFNRTGLTGRGPKLPAALVPLEAPPCWSPLIPVIPLNHIDIFLTCSADHNTGPYIITATTAVNLCTCDEMEGARSFGDGGQWAGLGDGRDQSLSLMLHF
uniref:Uncharacterized protein n=1 Tax=Salix viminalis TaxID=40686 RepID=A0A6N2LSD2_SALVM